MVDFTTVVFGPDGAAPVHDKAHLEDVNDDGFTDLVAHFRQNETGIQRGDVDAVLFGVTLDGIPFEGVDSIRTTPSSPAYAAAVDGAMSDLDDEPEATDTLFAQYFFLA
jgi:hypothetical protein